jgi:hypothetical protein
MDDNLRIVEIFNGASNTWKLGSFSDVKNGMRFKMFEPDTLEQVGTIWIAYEDSYVNESGVWEIFAKEL